MTLYRVLGTKVEKEFAERVIEYCNKNNLTPSSLIRALLEKELEGKKPITEYYREINNRIEKLEKLILQLIEGRE